METDVLIVGAGPSGLALAAQLLRFKIDFKIIDKKATTTPYSKAIGVQARTLEIYEQIGLADDLVSLGTIAEKVRLVEGGEVRGEVFLKSLGEGMSPYPFLLIVEQGLHEKLLFDHITSASHEVLWNTELTGLTQSGDVVDAMMKTGDGKSETCKAKFLIACDGAKSIVRHTLGIDFFGSTIARLFYVADVSVEWNFPHDGLVVNLGRDNLTAFFPMPGKDRFRIVGTFPEGHQGDEGEILYEEIEQQIKKDIELDLNITDVNWFSVYKVHSRAVTRFSEGRCFLVGDSAHIHTPAGAQGMNTGIQDGYNLAWKLDLVLRGKADAALLDTYNDERLENAKHLLKTTDRFFQFGASEEWFVRFFRMHIFPYIANLALNLDVVKRVVFPLVSQIGISYRESRLSESSGEFEIKAGDRMPYFLANGRSVYDLLRSPKFHLLSFGESDMQMLEAEIAREFGDVIDFFLLQLSAEAKKKFGTETPFLVLLRPDNYIGLLTVEISARSVQEYLRKILRDPTAA
jgi:2-polyprenyl-6-methoxyphenol hydroxylase-like FAD-dependent oxidoreductase